MIAFGARPQWYTAEMSLPRKSFRHTPGGTTHALWFAGACGLVLAVAGMYSLSRPENSLVESKALKLGGEVPRVNSDPVVAPKPMHLAGPVSSGTLARGKQGVAFDEYTAVKIGSSYVLHCAWSTYHEKLYCYLEYSGPNDVRGLEARLKLYGNSGVVLAKGKAVFHESYIADPKEIKRRLGVDITHWKDGSVSWDRRLGGLNHSVDHLVADIYWR